MKLKKPCTPSLANTHRKRNKTEDTDGRFYLRKTVC